ncbi:MAG: hypothetical protein PVG66_00825 [Chromatiales bacterium]
MSRSLPLLVSLGIAAGLHAAALFWPAQKTISAQAGAAFVLNIRISGGRHLSKLMQPYLSRNRIRLKVKQSLFCRLCLPLRKLHNRYDKPGRFLNLYIQQLSSNHRQKNIGSLKQQSGRNRRKHRILPGNLL